MRLPPALRSAALVLLIVIALYIPVAHGSAGKEKEKKKAKPKKAKPAANNPKLKPDKGRRFFTRPECEEAYNRFKRADRVRWEPVKEIYNQLHESLNALRESGAPAGSEEAAPLVQLVSDFVGTRALIRAPLLDKTRIEMEDLVKSGDWATLQSKIPGVGTQDAHAGGCMLGCIYAGWQVRKGAPKSVPVDEKSPVFASSSSSSSSSSSTTTTTTTTTTSFSPLNSAPSSPLVRPEEGPSQEGVADTCFSTCVIDVVPPSERVRNWYKAGLFQPNDQRSHHHFVDALNAGRRPGELFDEWMSTALPVGDARAREVPGDLEPVSAALARWQCRDPTPVEPKRGLFSRKPALPLGTSSDPTGRATPNKAARLLGMDPPLRATSSDPTPQARSSQLLGRGPAPLPPGKAPQLSNRPIVRKEGAPNPRASLSLSEELRERMQSQNRGLRSVLVEPGHLPLKQRVAGLGVAPSLPRPALPNEWKSGASSLPVSSTSGSSSSASGPSMPSGAVSPPRPQRQDLANERQGGASSTPPMPASSGSSSSASGTGTPSGVTPPPVPPRRPPPPLTTISRAQPGVPNASPLPMERTIHSPGGRPAVPMAPKPQLRPRPGKQVGSSPSESSKSATDWSE